MVTPNKDNRTLDNVEDLLISSPLADVQNADDESLLVP